MFIQVNHAIIYKLFHLKDLESNTHFHLSASVTVWNRNESEVKE